MTKRLCGIVAGLVVAFGSAASADPVARTADLTIVLAIQGLGPIGLTATGATVMVDEAGGLGGRGQISVAASAITLSTPISIPVTTTTAVNAITAATLSNLAGAFSIGGAASNIPITETPCPPAASGIACVQQTGLGGPMGFSGTIAVIVAGGVRIPLPLSVIGLGLGGFNDQGFLFDAAPWTRKTGSVALLTTTTTEVVVAGSTFSMMHTFVTTLTQMGTTSTAASQLTLVSPTFVSALGNLLPVFSDFRIKFTDGQGLPTFVNEMVPEPGGALALVAAGAAVLLLAHKRRR